MCHAACTKPTATRARVLPRAMPLLLGKLRPADIDGRVAGKVNPVGSLMAGPRAIGGLLSTYQAWVLAVAPGDQVAWLGEFLDGLPNCRRQSPNAYLHGPDTASEGVLGQGEGDPVGIPSLDLHRCLIGQLAGQVVNHAVGPELLQHAIRSLGAKLTSSPLVSLELVEAAFDLPALGVEGGQFLGGSQPGIAHGGQQSVDLVGVFEHVLDDANGDRLGWLGFVAGSQSGQVAAVREDLQGAAGDLLLGPPDELGASLHKALPELHADQAAV